MSAYVICVNDSVEFVSMGHLYGATTKLEELAQRYYESRQLKYEFPEYVDYRKQYYWRIHIVDTDVPVDLIGRVLAEAMPTGDSRFVPDHHVELAVWLSEVRNVRT